MTTVHSILLLALIYFGGAASAQGIAIGFCIVQIITNFVIRSHWCETWAK